MTFESSENVCIQGNNGLRTEEGSVSHVTIKTLINIAKAIEIQCIEDSINEEILQEQDPDMTAGDQLKYLEVRNKCKAFKICQGSSRILFIQSAAGNFEENNG